MSAYVPVSPNVGKERRFPKSSAEEKAHQRRRAAALSDFHRLATQRQIQHAAILGVRLLATATVGAAARAINQHYAGLRRRGEEAA